MSTATVELFVLDDVPLRDAGEPLLRTKRPFDVLAQLVRRSDRVSERFRVAVHVAGNLVFFLSLPVRAAKELFPGAPTRWRIRNEIARKHLEISTSSMRTD